MTLRPHSIVHSILYDDKKGKAIGVKVLDAETKQEMDFFAKIIFLNASTLRKYFYFVELYLESFSEWFGEWQRSTWS